MTHRTYLLPLVLALLLLLSLTACGDSSSDDLQSGYDGVNRYLLGNDYIIGEDGLAYHYEDGLVYPAGWIPEEPYDPADDWGENWMDNWDI